MRVTSFAAGILLLGLGGFPPLNAVGSGVGAGQSASQQQPIPQAQQPLNVQVTVVNVFATVRDKHRAIISDLKQEDFKILEDGVE